jgi:CheY-like chemotaxis protein
MVKRFLLIDDDSDDRELFSEALSMVEPAIICDQATDGEEGLAWLQQNKEEPDLIFLDINMPILNGWQLLSLLKGMLNVVVEHANRKDYGKLCEAVHAMPQA